MPELLSSSLGSVGMHHHAVETTGLRVERSDEKVALVEAKSKAPSRDTSEVGKVEDMTIVAPSIRTEMKIILCFLWLTQPESTSAGIGVTREDVLHSQEAR